MKKIIAFVIVGVGWVISAVILAPFIAYSWAEKELKKSDNNG